MENLNQSSRATLELRAAQESDARRIADIHMAAFGTNAMLLAQFPTPSVRHGLRKCIEQKAAADIRDLNVAVMVVQDGDQIISFAKWTLPAMVLEAREEVPWIWPEGTDLAILDEWAARVEEAQQQILGQSPSYRLTFIGTDPRCERRGAATLLIQWGLKKCSEDRMPAYLESTPNAGPLYERLGFKDKGKVSLALEESAAYEEVCYLFEPVS